jgi:16S rRNA G966 N2-methylase RsmD
LVELKTRKDYLVLVPALSKTEFEELKLSIKNRKQHVPVIVNDKYEILDGHHRFKACQELGIAIDFFPPMKFENIFDEKEFVIETNLRRRHLTEFQRVEMGKALEDIESERAATRRKDTFFDTKKGVEAAKKRWMPLTSREVNRIKPQDNTKAVSYEIGKRVNLSHATYERGKKIIEKATPEQINSLRSGDIGIRKVYSQIRRDEKRNELIQAARNRLKIQDHSVIEKAGARKVVDTPSPYRLYNRDFREIGKEIEPNSVDLIITDPPYGQDQLPLYLDLSRRATEWLREGGSLITYAPTYALPQVLNSMQNQMLHYWWMFCVKHTGGRQRVHKYRLWVRFKPLLWFVKGPADSPPQNMVEDVDDFIVSKSPDENKNTHDYEQSTVEAAYLIQNLSVENQVVLDPFMGTGTTGVAALRLKRQFIGIDINEIHYTTARDRILRDSQPPLIR